MTTAVMPEQPTAPTGHPLRPVTIAAHLLPEEVVAGRRARSVRRLVLWSLVVLTLAIGGWYGLATVQTWQAEAELTAAEQDATRLTQQQRRYADVVETRAESQAINAQLRVLLADDLRWSTLLASVRGAAPDGVELSAMTAGLTPSGQGAAPATQGAGRLPSATEAKSIGSITITGVGTTKDEIAAYVDALGTVEGVANPYLDNATAFGRGMQFVVRVDITEESLGGRYTEQNDGGR